MKNLASSLSYKNKFLILGSGFSGSFFAKTLRKLGCTVLTTSRSASKDPNNFILYILTLNQILGANISLKY